jgi:uncharacterized protein (DUF169 family)
MSDAEHLQLLLGLRSPPVAVSFRAAAPAGVPRAAAAGPSGCSYWKRAALGHAFYTEAADHYHCPVGAYTHGVELPPAQAQELEGVVGTMVSLGYLRPEEVPGIPRRAEPFGVAVYAPLAQAPGEPDVVLVCGNGRQMMLLTEAVQAAGVGVQPGLMGRPTCAAIPEVMRSGRGVTSLGCIGNRVYTGLADEEFYFALPGKQVHAVVEKLATVVHANQALEGYHRQRLQAIPV